MLIDTHAHINFNAYKDDADEVIRRSLDNNTWMINVGSQYETSKRAMEIAQKYEKGVYASVGLHPIHLSTDLVKIKNDTEEIILKTKEEESKSINSFSPSFLYSKNSVFDYDKYKELAQNPKVVAIGEVGLDYYWRPKTTKKKELFKKGQKDLLLKQLELAKELNLPVIFHCRMAHKDLIQFLKENGEARPPAAAAHGFVGSVEELKEYLNFGYYIGFNGIIFKKIEGIDFEENIKYIPLDRILIETDCPYLTPFPMTGRNQPIYVRYVVEKIAEIKKIDCQKIAEITTQNAKDLFKV